jgi:hypothetical protein
LGIKVGADPELTPRTQIVTAPFAFRVATVDSAWGGNIKGQLSIGPDHFNTGDYTFIAGGEHKNNGSDYATIAGGRRDTLSGLYSAIGGGEYNATGAANAVVGGGAHNRAEASYATIGGGQYNLASGTASCVPGGNRDTASGISSTAIGGYRNIASGDFSFAAGYRAKAGFIGSFVWADYNMADLSASAPNQFVVRATNGAFFTAGKVNIVPDAGNATTAYMGDRYRDNGIVAWGKVTGSTGFVSTNEYGVSDVIRNSAGNYSITLDITADDAATLIPMAAAEVDAAPASAASARIVSINQTGTRTFDVYILNGNWTAVDNDFVFMVTARWKIINNMI